jgi:hypothetical protein
MVVKTGMAQNHLALWLPSTSTCWIGERAAYGVTLTAGADFVERCIRRDEFETLNSINNLPS